MEFSALSALAAILELAASVKKFGEARNVSHEEALKIFEKEEATPDQVAFLSVAENAEAVAATMIIDPDLLDRLRQDAKACVDKHVKELEKYKAIGARMKADDQAKQCMCAVLRQIKQFNNGKLVGDRLKNWWISYRCIN